MFPLATYVCTSQHREKGIQPGNQNVGDGINEPNLRLPLGPLFPATQPRSVSAARQAAKLDTASQYPNV
jgi:hypothetical protein